MIEPTKGRVLYFYPGIADALYQAPAANTKAAEPFYLTAMIAKVNEDGTINLAVIDENGHFDHYGRQNVRLPQDGDMVVGDESYAGWMPYQKGQAQKTEELMAKFGSNTAMPLPPGYPPADVPHHEAGEAHPASHDDEEVRKRIASAWTAPGVGHSAGAAKVG